jgi:glycerol-3-phosphate acyltransferase PlsX
MRIGIDMMGGDYAPESPLEGVMMALPDLPENTELVLFGDQDLIAKCVSGHATSALHIHHCPDNVAMGEHPTRVLSQHPNSSLVQGILALKNGEIDGFCGAGNTGAMLVASMYTVNAVPGVIRPCISTFLPCENGKTAILLDVGSNADCKPDVLYQFAILGSAYAQHVLGLENPAVALLNIGEEPEKGNLLTQAAHQLMKGSTDFNFIGNIEGRDLYTGKADVIVSDGFTGNVVLKMAEAMYTTFHKRGVNDAFLDRFNYENYGGTPILGIRSNVVIGHGISSPLAIRNMIFHTLDVVRASLPSHFENAFRK